MCNWGSQKNLKSLASKNLISKTEQTTEKKSWEPKMLAVKLPGQSYCIVASSSNLYVWNDESLMTDFIRISNKIEKLTSDRIFPSQEKIKIGKILKDSIKRLIPALTNFSYLLNRPSKLVNLAFENNVGIYHNNKDKML